MGKKMSCDSSMSYSLNSSATWVHSVMHSHPATNSNRVNVIEAVVCSRSHSAPLGGKPALLKRQRAATSRSCFSLSNSEVGSSVAE